MHHSHQNHHQHHHLHRQQQHHHQVETTLYHLPRPTKHHIDCLDNLLANLEHDYGLDLEQVRYIKITGSWENDDSIKYNMDLWIYPQPDSVLSSRCNNNDDDDDSGCATYKRQWWQ